MHNSDVGDSEIAFKLELKVSKIGRTSNKFSKYIETDGGY